MFDFMFILLEFRIKKFIIKKVFHFLFIIYFWLINLTFIQNLTIKMAINYSFSKIIIIHFIIHSIHYFFNHITIISSIIHHFIDFPIKFIIIF